MVAKEQAALRVLIDKSALDKLRKIAQENGQTLAAYMRLVVLQHLRTPLKIELSQKAS